MNLIPLSNLTHDDKAIKDFIKYYNSRDYKDIECDLIKKKIEEIIKTTDIQIRINKVLDDASELNRNDQFEFHLFCLMIDEIYIAMLSYYTMSISLYDCYRMNECYKKGMYNNST